MTKYDFELIEFFFADYGIKSDRNGDMLSVHLVDGIVLRFHNSDNEQDICFGFDGPWHCHAVDDGIQFSNNEGFYIELNGYLDFIEALVCGDIIVCSEYRKGSLCDVYPFHIQYLDEGDLKYIDNDTEYRLRRFVLEKKKIK